jgi:lipopolysaccharide assembly outer membrane protein LptD (OstA)
VARHDTFLIGDFPVAYWPKYTYDTRTKPGVFRGVGWGGSDRLGTVVTTTWAPLNLGLFSGLQRWSDLIVKADYYTMRGPAVGSEFTYERPSLEGTLETFYLKDKAERDKQPGTPLVKHENRGRVLWRHRQYPFGEKEWRVDAELSYLSDRSFLREFYEPEFKTGKEQETDLYVRRLRDNEGATLLLKKRINKFQTQTEAMPLLSYQRISQPLWEDRLNFTSQSEVGYLDTKIDDELNVTDPTTFTRLQRTTGNSVRFDSNNTIGWPFQLWIFKMKPFVGGRVTAYSKSLKDQGPNDGPAVGRLATLLGMDASTSFWRVYSLESKLLRIHRLRHIVTPEFRWEVAPTVTKDPDDLLQTVTGGPTNLLQYGLADGMDTYNSLVFGVRNRLQTQRGTPKTTVDLLDLDLEVHLLPKRNDTNKLVTHTVGNAEGFLIPKRDSFLQYDLRSQITDRISVVSERNEFNLDKFTFDVLNFGINFKRTPEWSHFVGFRHLNDISSTLILGTNLVLGEKWGLNFSEVYDFRSESVTGKTSSRNLATGVSLYRKAHDYTGIFTLNFDVANRNTSIKFDILPTGFKKPVGRRYSF